MRLLARSTVAAGFLFAIWMAGLGVSIAEAAPEGQMVWAFHVTLAPRWLDPADTESVATPFKILYALHDALVKPMPAGLNTPCLAESWSVSPDGNNYEFVLRQGARFHNGDPVTAEDVKFSFERYRGGAEKLLKDKVREVQVLDARRVRFVLKTPWPDFMTFYGTTAAGAGWVVPKKYVESVGDEGFKKAPIGAGPYRFVSFTPGVELVLEAFEGYWRKAPSIKRLVFKSVPDETTRAAALKRAEVDVAYFLTGPVAEEVRRTPGLRLVATRTNGVFFLYFAEQWDPKSPWHDQRVRLAASLALDRKAINEAEQLGFAGLTGNVVPRAMEFALPIDPHPYDPKRARQLLTEAGYPNGFDGGDLTPNPPYFSMAEAAANYLAAIGIRTRVRTMERAAFLAAWGEKKLRGVVLGGTGAGGNAATRIELLATRGGRYAYGVLPEVDDLFDRQAQEPDRKKREELLQQIQRILHERVVFAPIWENGFIRGVGPRVDEPALTLIPAYPYTAPYEEVRHKRRYRGAVGGASAAAVAHDAAPEGDRLGAGRIDRQLAHGGVHHDEPAGRIDEDRLASHAQEGEHSRLVRKDPGLIAVAVEARRLARSQVRLLRAHARRLADPRRGDDLPAPPAALVGQQQSEPSPVAQHDVEAAEGRLLACPVHEPGRVGLGAHRLPDLFLKIGGDRPPNRLRQDEPKHLRLGRGIGVAGSARRDPLVELGHRGHAAGSAQPERVDGQLRDVVAARVLLEESHAGRHLQEVPERRAPVLGARERRNVG
jgi:peptide/nickel transport system substrate-binding protein